MKKCTGHEKIFVQNLASKKGCGLYKEVRWEKLLK
jgi:hypothetical protein